MLVLDHNRSKQSILVWVWSVLGHCAWWGAGSDAYRCPERVAEARRSRVARSAIARDAVGALDVGAVLRLLSRFSAARSLPVTDQSTRTSRHREAKAAALRRCTVPGRQGFRTKTCLEERLRHGRGAVRAVLAEPMASLPDELVDAPVVDAVLAGELR